MRERFDFSSISRVLLDQRKPESFTAVEYYKTLFDYAFSQQNIIINEPDESDISKIISGQRNVPRDIGCIYQCPEHYQKLKNAVTRLLEEVFDSRFVVEQLCDLLIDDRTLSEEMRRSILTQKEDAAQFIASCIVMSLSRSFIPKSKTGKRADAKSFELSDFLYDCNYPAVNRVFLGREAELAIIHERLQSEQCLFLHGIGGIGKSELAKQYGKQFKKEYEHVLYLRYAGSLRETICKLDFVDDVPDMDEEDVFEMHYRFFKRLSAHTLVILDNFDALPEQEELFQEFLSLSFQVLVTTRNRVEAVPCYLVKEIGDIRALEALFYTYAPRSKSKPDIVRDIIKEVHHHTLTVEMAAKTMSAADLTPEAVLAGLRREGLHSSGSNKIRIQKDATISKATPIEHLIRLFQLQKLSIENQALLRNLCLMPASGIPKGLFGKWAGAEDFNGINALIDYGWIHEEEETYRISLHPFLKEVLGLVGRPSFTKCSEFIERLGQEYVVDVAGEIHFRDLLNLTKGIFQSIEMDDTSLAFHLLERVLIYLEKYMYYHTMEDVLNLMEAAIPRGAGHEREAATCEFYRGDEAWGCGKWELAEMHFQNGVASIRPFEADNVMLTISLHDKLSIYYLFTNQQEKYLQHSKMVVELRERYGLADSLNYEVGKVKLMFANAMNEGEAESLDLTSLLEKPQMKSFIGKVKETGKLSIRKEEFQSDLDKVEPEELPDNISAIFRGVKEGLQDIISEKQDEISFADIWEGLIEVASKQIMNK